MSDLKQYIKEGCFKEFSIKFDGTPSFAEAECIILRIVSKKIDIHEFVVVALHLYAEKQKSQDLVVYIIDTITRKLGLELKN